MDYYKTYCSSHPYEYVTNYCCQKDCLVGLCATCICQHTQMHLQNGTKPTYQNIKTTYSRMNQKVREQINLIEADKQWLNEVCQKMQGKTQRVKDTLEKARKDCLEIINKHFDDLETKITTEIGNEAKKHSFHSQYRLDSLNTLILKEISTLLFYAKDLSSTKFLDTAKRVETEVLVNSGDFHKKVTHQLRQNQIYTANIVYKEQYLNNLTLTLKSLVGLQFLLPQPEYLETASRTFSVSRPSSPVQKSNSTLILQNPRSIPKLIPTSPHKVQTPKYRNISTVLPQKQQQSSLIYSMSPLLQSTVSVGPIRNNSEIMNRHSGINITQSALHKTSKIQHSGLKTIKESLKELGEHSNRRESVVSEISEASKENEALAYSTFYDTGSNFFK